MIKTKASVSGGSKPGWKPGQSGNPKGRPPGSGEVAKLRAAMADRLPDIVDALVNKALEGDVGAARLLLERVVAPMKAVEPSQMVNLAGKTLADQGRSVITALANGDLAVSQAGALLSSLGTMAKLVEVDELTRRIQVLEERHAAR